MKLIQNMVGDITSLGIFPVISLILFLLVFIAIVWNTMHLKKKFTEDMANAPLFDNDENRTEINNL